MSFRRGEEYEIRVAWTKKEEILNAFVEVFDIFGILSRKQRIDRTAHISLLLFTKLSTEAFYLSQKLSKSASYQMETCRKDLNSILVQSALKKWIMGRSRSQEFYQEVPFQKKVLKMLGSQK